MFFLSRAYILLPFMLIALLTALINAQSTETAKINGEQDAEPFHWIGIGKVVVVQILVIVLIVKVLI